MKVDIINKRTQLLALFLVTLTIFLDTLLFNLIIPIIPIYINKLGVPQSMIGILFGSYAAGLLITTPLWGIFSDRHGRKLPILIGLIGFAAATILFAFGRNFFELFIARLFQGIASAASFNSCLALLADFYPAGKRGKFMGFALTAISVGSLLGAPIGGFLYEKGGQAFPFLIVTFFIILDFIFFLFLSFPELKPQEKTSILSLIKKPSILIICIIEFSANSIISMIEPIFPLFLEKKMSATPLSIGLLFGAATFAYGIISPIAGKVSDRVNKYSIMTAGFFLIALSLPFIVLSNNLWQETFSMLFLGASIGLTLTPTLPAVAEIVECENSDSYASAFSIYDLYYALSMLIAPVFGGLLADAIGINNLTFVVSGSSLVFAILLIIIRKKR